MAALPTARGFAPTAFPQHLASEQLQSTDSTGSQDSIMTQVPLPFHQMSAQVYQQEPVYAYTGSAAQSFGGGFDRPWGAPGGMTRSSTLPNMSAHSRHDEQSHSRSLNPSSAPYYPQGYPPQFPHTENFASQAYGQDNNNFAADVQGYQQPQGMSYPNTVPYPQIGGPVGGPGAQFSGNQYGMPPPPNPYGEFSPPPMGMNNYNQIPQPYGPVGTVASPTPSYLSMTSSPSYGNMNYGAGPSNEIHQPTSHGQGPGMNMPPHSAYPGGIYNNGNGYAVQSPQYYSQPSNVNRGKSAYFNGKQSVGSRPTSNLATAPVLNANSHRKNNSTSSVKFGGPVLAPSTRGSSPGRSAHPSTRTSSPDRVSRISVDNHADDGGPTPGPKTQPLDLEFSSEPRNQETPTLRSRRGQSVSTSGAMTDPTRKQSTASWLENIPALGNPGSQERQQSPPKMLSLLSAGGVDPSSLAPINEGDPFTSGPDSASRNYTNPFAPVPSTALVGPYNGNALAGPSSVSSQLRALTDGGKRKPTADEALGAHNLPFAEYCRLAKEDTWGVIKIKNIPYSVNRPEVLAFLGRNARIISEQEHEPVHIVMERVTSKTLDCYVEFVSLNEAVAAVNRFETNRTGGRGGRLGQRHVEVELSSQEQLMHDLFPKAKNVTWKGSRPIITPRDENDPYNSGFQGFVSKEELVMLVKHVEAPQRSPFSKDCPQRPFECLISTLLKYPWYMVEHITLEDRILLFDATVNLLKLLEERINNPPNDEPNVNLNSMLFRRVWRAALRCIGFTPAQKDDIVYLFHVDERIARELGVPIFAADWKYLWCIGPKTGVPDDLLLWYIAIIREATEKKEQLSLAEQAARGEDQEVRKLFGDLDLHIEYPKERLHRTLSQIAQAEWAAIEKVLRFALTPALE